MKKIIVLVLAAVCMLACVACGKSKEDELKEAMLGAWDEDTTGGIQVITINDDMTYESYIRLESHGIVTEDKKKNKYQLKDEQITVHYSTFGGITSVYKVVVEGDRMSWTLIDNPTAVREFTRKK